MWGFYNKLNQLKRHLRQWNKDVFGYIFDAFAFSETEVTSCERQYDSSPSEESRAAYQLSMTQLRLA